jgi:hypothetical protein
MKKIKLFEEFVSEVSKQMISGTSARTITTLDNRKYELKRDVKGARIGDFVNVTLPKGTIIYNLPGGLFAGHFSLKSRYTTPYGNGPKWLSQSWGQGVSIRQMPETLADIEKNSKVLESEVNEAKKQKFVLYTNPGNSTSAGYVAIGAADVKDLLHHAKRYSDSYKILYQGSGTQDDLVKAKQMFSDYSFGDESIDEGMISPKMANGFKIGNKIKTQKGTYTITGFGSKTGATRDFEAENEDGDKFNLRVSLRGATGIQVAAGKSLNFPEQEEMLESIVNEASYGQNYLYEIATPAPAHQLAQQLEKMFGSRIIHWKNLLNSVTNFKSPDGLESVVMFNLSPSDISKIKYEIGDVLIFKMEITNRNEM